MENMQNYANAIWRGLREIQQILFPFCKKKWNRKIMRNFSTFFSFLCDLGRSNLINSRNNETSDYPWFIFFSLRFSLSVCTAGAVTGKSCNVCGRKFLKRYGKTLCDLYANFEGKKSWITTLPLQIFSWI